ncbi:MAG: MFS transporter [Candidatus Altiarchaeales archaeon]|nr:MAG: MFS transporter [Candidatus Altiarchaeales archaeon]
MNQKTENRFLQGIGINVLLLGIVSFLTDISSEMIHPLLPMFIVALGGSGLVVGIIGGLGDSITSILTVLSGYLSDRSGERKPFVFSGYGISSIAKLLLAFSTHWGHVLILRPLERTGKGLRTAPRDAIIAESERGVRGRAFGIHRAMDTSGAIIGSVLAFILLWFLGMRFETIFLLAGFIGLLALIPLFYVRERRREPKKLTLKIGLGALPREFRVFLLIVTVFALGNFTYMFFILRAQESFPDPRMAIALPVLLYVWFNIVYTIFSIPAGILSDRIGRKNVLIMGYGIFGITCLGFALFESFHVLIILFGLYGLFFALVDGTQRAFASDLITEDLRGTALGTFHTAIAFATLPASVIAGSLYQYFSPEATFFYGAGIAFLSAILFLIADTGRVT